MLICAFLRTFAANMHTLLTILAIFFVQFTDKVGSERVCLSPLALEMRTARRIAIDELDYEVSPMYLDSLRNMGATVLHTSRWMNGATISMPLQAVSTLSQCDFIDHLEITRDDAQVFGISSVSLRKREVIQEAEHADTDPAFITPTKLQLSQINLPPLHEAGYRGKGIRIGVADAGFYNADSMPSLPKEQWLGYADFTDDTDDFFGATSDHGSLCLSAIVAKTPGYSGAATEAEYFLFRTEESITESPKEIDNWVAAIEMADSLGLHIVSTSLGYSRFDNSIYDFTYQKMDGQTTRGARAATTAARKGMLLVMAIGNEGNKSWHYLSTPSDADSIITVGAVDSEGAMAAFSSWGPSADGRIKPEVCAMGKDTYMIDPSDNRITQSDGTSFACPLIAGMAACLWSAIPEASNMEIRERIIRSADRYLQPHNHYGYGIPNAWLAYTSATNIQSPTTNGQIAYKIFKDGHIYIQCNNQTYDLLGNKLD